MVVDGRTQFVGSDGRAALRAVERALTASHARVILAARSLDGKQPGDTKTAPVHVSVTVARLSPAGRGDRADIIVAITEDHLRSSVTRGENRGRMLTHVAVVRSMTTIGRVAGTSGSAEADLQLAPDWNRGELKVVAFVQEQRGRAILGAAAAPLRTLAQ
jgi:hypothetical protein